MTSPARRREAAQQAQTAVAVSERRACEAIEQPRSTQRYRPQRTSDEVRLVERMHALVRQHPRYGYRRIWALLRGEGWRVNRKRIYRLWKQEKFKVPRRQRKKRRLGRSDNGILRHRSQHKDHVWAWDFVHDRDERGRPLKWFALVDEYTRECLALEVERSMTADAVVDILAQVLIIRGAPQFIRSDNGPEFIARAMRGYLAAAQIGTLYIEPGSPWENGYAESFNGKLRDELLNAESFADLREARALGAAWQSEYNHRRPHGSLGYETPAAFAATCAAERSRASLGALPPNPRQGLCPWTPASSPPPCAIGAALEDEELASTLIAPGT